MRCAMLRSIPLLLCCSCAVGVSDIDGGTDDNDSGKPAHDSRTTLDIAQRAIDSKSSGTGPVNGTVATSADNFAATSSLGMNSVAMVVVNAKGSKQPVEVRLYGYGASATGGTFRIENTFTVTG